MILPIILMGIGGVVFIVGVILLYKVPIEMASVTPFNATSAEEKVAVDSLFVERSYPKHTRDLLDKAMLDLSDILNWNADAVVNLSAQMQITWDSTVSKLGNRVDVKPLLQQIYAIEKASAELYKAIDDTNGFRWQYKTNEVEINDVLRLPQNSPNSNAIDIFQSKLASLHSGMEAIERAQKHGDARLLDDMGQMMRSALFEFQGGDHNFRVWLDETRKRITVLRAELQKQGN